MLQSSSFACTPSTEASSSHGLRPGLGTLPVPLMSTLALRGASVRSDSYPVGRNLVADADLPAGFVVCEVAHAHAITLHEEWMHAICAACYSVSKDEALPIKCEKCGRAYYCSDACKRRHHQDGVPGAVAHRHVCETLQQFGPLKRQGSLLKPQLILELLARRYLLGEANAAAVAQFEELDEHEQIWPGGDESEDKLAFEQWCNDLRSAFSQTAPWASLVPDAAINDEALYGLLSRIDVNGFECCVSARGMAAPCGTAIYLQGATLFNHSCQPSCKVTFQLPSLTVTTSAPVPAGAPLTISYMKDAPIMTRDYRQHVLIGQYGFQCACTLCDQQELKPGIPPRILANCHRRGDHYVLAVGMWAAGVYWPLVILFLVVYFAVWTQICRFPL